MTEQEVHKRFLDYRERHEYFGRHKKIFGYAEFKELDAEHRALAARKRDDEEEERFEELASLLFRD